MEDLVLPQPQVSYAHCPESLSTLQGRTHLRKEGNGKREGGRERVREGGTEGASEGRRQRK